MYESMHDWVGPQVLHTFKTVSMKVSVHKHFANTWILCWASLIFYAVDRQICMSTHTDNKDSVFWRKQMVIIHWQHIIPWKTYMNWPATLHWDWTWPMTAPLCVQQVWISVCSWVSADKERKAVSIPSLAAGACAIQRICDLWEANFLWRSDSEPPCDCGMLFLQTEKGSQHTKSGCRSLFNSEDMWLQRIWFWTTMWLWHVISANRERQSAYHVCLQKLVQFRGYVTCEKQTFLEDLILNHPVTVACYFWKQRKAVSIPRLSAEACSIQRICDLWEANFLRGSDSEPPCDYGMLFLQTEKGSQHTMSGCRSMCNSEGMWLVRGQLSLKIWTTLWLWHVESNQVSFQVSLYSDDRYTTTSGEGEQVQSNQWFRRYGSNWNFWGL